jgi:hypothetical protein
MISESVLKHFSITSLQRKANTCPSIGYAVLDLILSVSQALLNHISAKKGMYMPFY